MRLLLVLAALGLLLIGGVIYFSLPTYSWHQKMTITVDANGAVYSGSSVVRIRWSKNDPLGSVNGPGWITTVRGEAPFVEVPGKGVLFALLNPPDRYNYATDLALRAFRDVLPNAQAAARLRALQSEPGRSVPLSRNLYPFFVTFSDLNNPNSVREVDPSNVAGDFGSGVRLISVTLEITKASITKGRIEEVVPWINSDQVLKNPAWRNLSRLTQRTVVELKHPVGD